MNRKMLWLWVKRIFLLRSPWFYVVIFTLFFLPAYFCLDPDFGWHIMAGKAVLEHGIPAHDLFTYTASDFPWILHEWLSDTINYSVYALGGYTTLAVMYAGLWTFAVGLASRRLPARLVAVMASVAILPYSGVRAITWTAVWFMLLVTVQESRRWNRRWWLSPLIILVWANMHGSFVLGLVYLVWRCIKQPSRRSIFVLGVSAVITVINPYGIALYREVLATLGDTALHSRISEWQSLNLTVMTGIIAGILIGLLAIQRAPWHKKLVRFDGLLFIMALSSVRHTVPLVLYLLTSIADVSRDVLAQLPKKTTQNKVIPRLMGVATLIACITIIIFTIKTLYPMSYRREAGYPQHIAATLRANPCRGNVFANYDYGGYLIWRVPGEKVYIDGRMPSWRYNGTSYMDNYLKILDDAAYQKAQFARYDVRCVVWDKNSDFAKRLQKQGWRIVQQEPTNTIVLLVVY